MEQQPDSAPESEEKPPLFTTIKSREFLIGFFGWYFINGLIWAILEMFYSYLGNYSGWYLELLIFPINLLVLIILSAMKRTRKIGLGILAALALNFLLSLILGLLFNGVCFVPFFIDTGIRFWQCKCSAGFMSEQAQNNMKLTRKQYTLKQRNGTF